jgi:Glyoxalase-like domain
LAVSKGTYVRSHLHRGCDATALGGVRLKRHEPALPLSHGFIVMADPEGNEFCLD